QLEEIEASYRSQLEQREAELHGRVTDAETAARTAVHDLQAVRDEVTAARAEAASREQQLLEAHNEIARIRGELKGHTSEVKERTAAVGQARKEADEMRRSLTALQEDLARADGTIEQLRGELEGERLRNAETDAVARDEQDAVVEMPVEDRRGTTPFMKELSLDAKKSVAKINGITQLLKHKKDQKDQAQLIKQLTGHARRLDNLVADIADAER